jgi:ABC-2 type transport system ATP-binding protein
LLAGKGEIVRSELDGHTVWTIDLANGVDAQDVLKACVDGNVKLARFEPVRAHLHDAFVHLVGASAATETEAV